MGIFSEEVTGDYPNEVSNALKDAVFNMVSSKLTTQYVNDAIDRIATHAVGALFGLRRSHYVGKEWELASSGPIYQELAKLVSARAGQIIQDATPKSLGISKSEVIRLIKDQTRDLVEWFCQNDAHFRISAKISSVVEEELESVLPDRVIRSLVREQIKLALQNFGGSHD